MCVFFFVFIELLVVFVGFPWSLLVSEINSTKRANKSQIPKFENSYIYFNPILVHFFQNDHGGYMSVGHTSLHLDHIFMVYWLLNYFKFWWLDQFLQPRFSTFGLHVDNGVGTVSWYIVLIYFLKNISLNHFAWGRCDIDLSTFYLVLWNHLASRNQNL